MLRLALRFAPILACWLLANLAAQDPSPSSPPPAPPVQDPPKVDPPKTGQGPLPSPLPIPVDVEADQHGAPVRNLTLGDALRVGRFGNVGLRAAELLPEQARMDLFLAEAGFVPELYGAGGYAERQSPQRNAFSPSITSQTLDAQLGWRQRVITGGLFDLAFQPSRFDSSGASQFFPGTQFTSEWIASFRQPLLRAAWSDYHLAPIQSARHRLNQADFDYERSIQDTLLAIVQAYWELAFARENWRVVRQALAVGEEQLRITDERIRVQALAPRDRIADEAEVARRREQLIVAENAIRTREDDVRRLLFDGIDGGLWQINVRPTSPIAVELRTSPLALEPLIDVALQQRPDLRSLRSGVAAAEIAELQAERDTLPNLDLVTSYSSDGVREQFRPAFSDALDQQFPDWSVRLEFAIPLGNQAARSRAQRASLEVERQRRLLHAAVLDITRQVREVVRNLDTLSQSILASGESVRLATANLETEQVKLRVGSSTAFEVQRRNQELLEAQSRLLRNQLDYRTAESRLLHVQGRLTADGE
jgi:outer membrane protein